MPLTISDNYDSADPSLTLVKVLPEESAIGRTEVAVTFEVGDVIYITLAASIGFRSLDFILDAPPEYSSLGVTDGLLGKIMIQY